MRLIPRDIQDTMNHGIASACNGRWGMCAVAVTKNQLFNKKKRPRIKLDDYRKIDVVFSLCAPVFIFTSGSSALLGRPHCALSICLSLLAICNTLF